MNVIHIYSKLPILTSGNDQSDLNTKVSAKSFFVKPVSLEKGKKHPIWQI